MKLGKGGLDAIYPVGTIITTSTNQNPSNTLGGTWQLIDKEFSNLTSGRRGFNRNENNVATENPLFVSRSGHTLNFELTFNSAVDIDDSTISLGNIDFEEIGITRINHTLRVVGASDGGNATIIFEVNATTGEIKTTDVIGVNSIPSGNSCYFYASTSVVVDYMLDNACSKFYWKRTS